ncbi:AAA family ATPase [Phocaeicola fibrisolvens]|uniref:AAA family ATPase n=1 Tax=Phocaeicola fibrisolvens TaxID=2981793 RepID=UPI0011DD9652|nr:AAA family ATPase [Phocaeicola fibrisolvens]MCU6777117.1 ATP-binding protein [Phocaeicola fibrisolvens]
MMPVYTLFQADRSNGDKDKEVQDPLKEAVKIIMASSDIKLKCQEIYNAVIEQLQLVSNRTVEKINEMNPTLANTLHPTLPTIDDLKWVDVFKSVSITGDDDIPINKRGSGVKRLILINFFRAEAERKQEKAKSPGIIYAIEEPETAQHAYHQNLLIHALKELSKKDNIQVIITTHSSLILKQLTFDEVRLVKDAEQGKKIERINESQLPYPSLNEIAYTAFGDSSIEYHNELYSYIESEGWKRDFETGKPQIPYVKIIKNGTKIEQLIKTEIIRHQIHHPENTLNKPFTQEELNSSIQEMRIFIERHKAAKK